ncbi:MAG: alpha/beta hydrolase [Clostridiales bacterium]|nr:alpha/beta hydrolase [Candidatus Crickella equi]
MKDRVLYWLAQRMQKNFEKKNPDISNVPEGDFDYIHNIQFRSQDGTNLMMDVFRPKRSVEDAENSAVDKFPVIVAIHGGGLFLGENSYYYKTAQVMAKKGFMTCIIDYRHLPEVMVYEEIADVCAGMDCIYDKLDELGGDPERVYLMAESAGAYLGVYANAMKYSTRLQQAVGYQPSKLNIRAMGLMCGMFYTKRKGVASILASSMYGKGTKAIAMKPYTNPEHSDVIGNLPPCILITSDSDFLKKYSCDYAKALTENGIENELLNMGDNKLLTHSFMNIHPEYEESQLALEKTAEWFRAQHN